MLGSPVLALGGGLFDALRHSNWQTTPKIWRLRNVRCESNYFFNANVDVIVTSSTPAIQIVREVTSKKPVVFARVGDAVDQGIVQSLA